MKVQVLIPSKIQTKQGERELNEGDILKLDDSLARHLIAQGKVKKVKMLPRKIYSKVLREHVWMVADQEDMESLASRGVKEVVYVGWEIALLGMESKETQEAVHR